MDRFVPAPVGDALVVTPDAAVTGHVAPAAGATLSFADRPLVLTALREGKREEVGAIVSHQLIAHHRGSLALFDQWLLDVDLPVVFAQGGDSPSTASASYSSPHRATLGDWGAGTRLQVLRQQGSGPALAITSRLWVPTGQGDYAGADVLRYSLGFVAGADHGNTIWRLTVERRRGDDRAVYPTLGSDVYAAVGTAWRHHRIQLGAELFGATQAHGERASFSSDNTHLEALFSMRYRAPRLMGGVAMGPGMAAGAGTPSYRLVATLAWISPSLSRRERDLAPALTPRTQASTPWVPEPDRHPQPFLLDRDGDAIPDGVDRCPTLVGTAEGEHPGCPSDRDHDGIVDVHDRCPHEPGVPGPAGRYGCPADTDEDGIPDVEDPCPREPGREATAQPQGCPSGLRRVGQQLVVDQEILFETGKNRLTSDSTALMTRVAAYLEAHPEIKRLAIDGHTDNAGDEAQNLALSRRRAVAVLRALLDAGVDERRLEVRAFGPRRPKATNATAEGRSANRRVEFTILATTRVGEDGWDDGPIGE